MFDELQNQLGACRYVPRDSRGESALNVDYRRSTRYRITSVTARGRYTELERLSVTVQSTKRYALKCRQTDQKVPRYIRDALLV